MHFANKFICLNAVSANVLQFEPERATGARLQIAQREARGVARRLACSVGRHGARLGGARLADGIHASKHAHWQGHVRVLAAPEKVTQDVAGVALDESDDLVVRRLIHSLNTLVCGFDSD